MAAHAAAAFASFARLSACSLLLARRCIRYGDGTALSAAAMGAVIDEIWAALEESV